MPLTYCAEKPPVGKRDESPVRPPESVLKLNRLWIANLGTENEDGI